MTTDTHTKAGLLASAGAARLGAVTPVDSAAYGAPVAHQVSRASGNHPSSTWTRGAIAKSTTFMVLNGKTRPTRPLSELSP